MKKEIVNCKSAAPARGPYSHAVKVGNLLFISGRTPSNLKTGELLDTDVKDATKLAIENLKLILEDAGSSLKNVVKTTVFIRDMADFEEVNKVYCEYFKVDPPARSCVEIGKLPRNAAVEIEAIAMI